MFTVYTSANFSCYHDIDHGVVITPKVPAWARADAADSSFQGTREWETVAIPTTTPWSLTVVPQVASSPDMPRNATTKRLTAHGTKQPPTWFWIWDVSLPEWFRDWVTPTPLSVRLEITMTKKPMLQEPSFIITTNQLVASAFVSQARYLADTGYWKAVLTVCGLFSYAQFPTPQISVRMDAIGTASLDKAKPTMVNVQVEFALVGSLVELKPPTHGPTEIIATLQAEVESQVEEQYGGLDTDNN